MLVATRFEDTWLSDDPLDETGTPGEFDRGDLATKVVSILARVRQKSLSTTLGLIGPWGSGKTTVLEELVRQLNVPNSATRDETSKTWSVARFNPWLYSDPLALHEGFFAELRNALPSEDRWSETRSQIAKIGRAAAPFGAVTSLIGLDTSRLIDAFANQIAQTTTAQRQKVERALRDLDRPILMVVDDLDRLSSDELLHMFKLVRLVGRLPNVYYILSYDEHTLTDLLSKTDLVGESGDRRSLDYIEKIVQVRIDIPLLRLDEVDHAIDQGMQAVTDRHDVRQLPADKQDLQFYFTSTLGQRLRTPRALKRYFGQLDSFLPSVGQEVHFGDFAVLTWLRTVEPGVYNLLQSCRHLLLGERRNPLRESGLARKVQNAVLRAEWVERLAEARVGDADQDDVLYVLCRLFPRLQQIYSGTGENRNDSGGYPKPGRIAHPDYFDRYFVFGVPTDDIGDGVLARAVGQIDGGQLGGKETGELAAKFVREPDLIIRKLGTLIDSNPSSRPGLVRWLAERYADSDPLGGVRQRLEGLISRVVLSLETAARDRDFEKLAQTDSGLYLVSRIQSILASATYGAIVEIEAAHDVASEMRPVVSDLLRVRFDTLADLVQSPLDVPAAADSLKWPWRSIDSEGFHTFLAAQVASRRWLLLDELAWLVPTSVSVDGRHYITEYDEISHFEGLFDLDTAAVSLSDELPEEGSTAFYHGLEATNGNRRAYALALLRNREAQRARETEAGLSPG